MSSDAGKIALQVATSGYWRTMSQESVEIIRRAWDAWLCGDLPGVFRQYDPEVVRDMTHFPDWPEGTYRGHEGLRRYFDEWLGLWDGYEVGVDDLLPAPDGRVVVLFWQRGRGRTSGLAMEMEIAQIATVRDGKIAAHSMIYGDRKEALEAVGLSE